MNIPGHAGLALAAAYSIQSLINKLRSPRQRRAALAASPNAAAGTPANIARPNLALDYRLVILGSLLPDIIDKPLAFWLAPELVNHATRSIGHTLLFNAALLSVALFLGQRIGYGRPLTLALASFSHLLLDSIWQNPVTLWWPLYGWQFPMGTTTLDEWMRFMTSFRIRSLPEMLGLVSLSWFAIRVIWRRSAFQFIKTGHV